MAKFMEFIVQYENDVGPDDDYFHEFWEVFLVEKGRTKYTGTKICQCDKEENAKLIRSALENAKLHGFFK